MRVQQSFKCLTFVNNGDISTSLLEGKLREQFKYKPDFLMKFINHSFFKK
jgi:hypothetical protein